MNWVGAKTGSAKFVCDWVPWARRRGNVGPGRTVRSARVPEPAATPIAEKQGELMTTVVAHHDVKDTDHWLASPKREEFFGPLGVTNIRTFVDPQNPTHVAVLMDVADMDALMGAMQSEGAAAAMTHDGVLPETLVILLER